MRWIDQMKTTIPEQFNIFYDDSKQYIWQLIDK